MESEFPLNDTCITKAEEWIRRTAFIGIHDDPCAVASEAAGIMRALLDQLRTNSGYFQQGGVVPRADTMPVIIDPGQPALKDRRR
jgi:hypothetical protein